MNAVVQPIFTPGLEAMRQHVEHLFGGYLDGCHDGLIELAWTDTKPDESGRYRLKNAKLFGTDKIDELIEEAARLNAIPMCNVYIGAALRHPNTAPFGRTNDKDAWALTCGYVDLDNPSAATDAKDIYGIDKPTMVVVTGREPHTRAQMWWRLEEPMMDPAQWPVLLRGMATKLSGDTSVTNPARVMRLAGTIAWPVKPGRTVELTSIAPIREPGRNSYSFEYLSRMFPFSEPVRHPDPTASHTLLKALAVKKSEFFREVNDRALKDTGAWVPAIFGADAKLQQGTGAWRVSSKALGRDLEEDLSIAPNGIVDFGIADMGDPNNGKRSPIDIVIEHGGAPGAKEAALYLCDMLALNPARLGWEESSSGGNEADFEMASAKIEQLAKTDPSALFEYLNVGQIKNMPDPEWLVAGLVVEQALGFIYGPPGCLKTFIALSMGLSFAVGVSDWWGRKIERPGAVVYISSEGQSDLKFRIQAWEKKNEVLSDGSPFYLIRETINFMKPGDVGKLLATVQAIADAAGVKIAAVFVDTVSRTLPGADENLQKDMTLFVAACDAVRQRFGATVVGVHHTSRNGNMRGSTVFPGAGDFLVEVMREEGAMHGSIKATKIKAAEDGWEQHFKVEKIQLGNIGGTQSLVVEAIKDPPRKTGGTGWPDTDVCKQIIVAIDEQWCAGKPWCFANNSSRSAIANIAKRWHLKRGVVADMLSTWVANEAIEEAERDTKNHVKGYRKTGGIE